MSLAIAFAAVYIGTPPAVADQHVIDDYDDARDKHAYTLYVDASASQAADIYCGIRFKVNEADPAKRPADWLSLEHAYPANWIVKAVGCTAGRTACRKDADQTRRERFNHAEGDLHNLWPAHLSLNSARGDRLLGEIPGEATREVEAFGRTFTCDFESQSGIVDASPNRAGQPSALDLLPTYARSTTSPLIPTCWLSSNAGIEATGRPRLSASAMT